MSSRRAGVLGLMLVALTAAMLALAGTSPRGIGAPTDQVSQVQLDQRTFVCEASLPGTQVHLGTVVAGPRPVRKATAPEIVNVDRDQARGAFAAEQADGARWSAWSPCPEAHARWWFVGAGGAPNTHDTVLTISNPRAGAAVYDIDVFGPSGPVAAPGLHGRTIAAGATQRFDLGAVAPNVGELAVKVTASRGLVAVSAADTFSPGAVGKQVREWLPATTLPAKHITIAGLPRRPSGATLLLVNPGAIETVAQVEVIGPGGTFAPQGVLPMTIPPQSVRTVALTSVFNGSPQAVRVTGTGPLTATVRIARGNDIAFGAGVLPIRGATAVAVPPGTSRELVLSALGPAGAVTVTGYDAKAHRILSSTVTVPAHASVVVTLARNLSYLRLASASGDVVGGISVDGAHGPVTSGVAPAIRSIRLPVIRPGW